MVQTITNNGATIQTGGGTIVIDKVGTITIVKGK